MLYRREEVMRSSMAPHLNLSRAFVSTAGNMDHKWPFIWLHEYSSSLGTGGVVGSGATAMRALHAAAGCLLHPLLTVVTFLSEMKTKGARAQGTAVNLDSVTVKFTHKDQF